MLSIIHFNRLHALEWILCFDGEPLRTIFHWVFRRDYAYRKTLIWILATLTSMSSNSDVGHFSPRSLSPSQYFVYSNVTLVTSCVMIMKLWTLAIKCIILVLRVSHLSFLD